MHYNFPEIFLLKEEDNIITIKINNKFKITFKANEVLSLRENLILGEFNILRKCSFFIKVRKRPNEKAIAFNYRVLELSLLCCMRNVSHSSEPHSRPQSFFHVGISFYVCMWAKVNGMPEFEIPRTIVNLSTRSIPRSRSISSIHRETKCPHFSAIHTS